MEINLTKPKEEILMEWANHIRSQAPDLSEEDALELAKKTMPYLECPLNNNKRVSPMKCMFCHYGHMSECHHPLTCSEAECSHYTREIEYESYYNLGGGF